MDANTDTNLSSAAASGVGDAVGVEKSLWYVAIVNNNTEKASAEKLTKAGIEHYLPTQIEHKVWKNGRKAKVVRVIIPCTIFIHCTDKERLEMVRLPYISRFMTDKAKSAAGTLSKPLAIIPEHQIENLKFMLGQSDIPVTIGTCTFQKGDKVRVIRGNLKGLEGKVMDMKKEKSELVVTLDYFGCARLTIDTVNLEILN